MTHGAGSGGIGDGGFGFMLPTKDDMTGDGGSGI